MKSELKTVFPVLSTMLLGLAGASFATSAAAQEESSEFGSISASVTFASDYIFRGVSMSDEDPAIQGGLTWSHDSGVYVGAWGSSGEFNGGAGNVEFDYFVGFATEVNGITFDISATYYTYPGDQNDGNYFEFMGKVGYDFGLAGITAGVAYVPSGQDAYGGNDAIYIFGDVGVPIPKTPLTINLHLGYEDFGGGSNKLDWSAGIVASVLGVDIGVAYVDTDIKNFAPADSRVLFTVSKSF